MMPSSIAVGITAALLASGAAGAELEYGADIGIGTSDNIGRVPAGEESETIATAGVDLRLLREGSRLDADVDVDLSYFDYQGNAYDSEVTGMANADIRYKFLPDRFEWVLMDSFGQSAMDPFAASTPGNRENINFFTTGPDFAMRLGSLARLTIFGRYSLVDYEESELGNERLLGGLSLARELSARSNLSLNATAERVEFDSSGFGSDYDRQSAFLRYEIDGARTRIGAEAGYTEIHDLESTSSTPLFELEIERDLSAQSMLTVSGGVRSSDAASALRADNIMGGGIPSSPEQVSTADPFETRHATLGWQFNAPRTNITLSAGYEEDAYERDTVLDRQRNFVEASAQRQITPRLSIRAQGSLYSTDYDSAGQDDDETRLGLFLSWNVTGRLYVEADAEYFNRDSSNPLTEYDETRVFLRLAWRNTGGTSGVR